MLRPWSVLLPSSSSASTSPGLFCLCVLAIHAFEAGFAQAYRPAESVRPWLSDRNRPDQRPRDPVVPTVSQPRLSDDAKRRGSLVSVLKARADNTDLQSLDHLGGVAADVLAPQHASAVRTERAQHQRTKDDTTAPGTTTPSDKTGASARQPAGDAFLSSFVVILISEIGDKTFLIAALMAMKHPRAIVYAGAASALVTMTVLSTILGYALPNLLSRKWTSFGAMILFLIFGIRMIMEAQAMTGNEVADEIDSVAVEIAEQQATSPTVASPNQQPPSFFAKPATTNASPHGAIPMSMINTPTAHNTPDAAMLESGGQAPSSAAWKANRQHSPLNSALRLAGYFLNPIAVQTFTMTFLGEWGDRSQIATIALAAAKDPYWVTIGATLGHLICTAVAVIGGRLLASKISVKMVTLSGGILFLIFALSEAYEILFTTS